MSRPVHNKTLVIFDTEKPAVTKKMDVTGVTPDYRIVSINLETGAATDVAKMDKILTMTQAPVVVDFNPGQPTIVSTRILAL